MSTSPSRSTHLSTAECWTALEGQSVGRLALTDDKGAPDIFPVNFVAHEGSVYIRSAPDVKLVRIAAHPVGAFEVDGHDGTGWWSVVLRGPVERVQDAVEVARSGISRVSTPSPRVKQHVIRLTATAVTGRRFADRTDAPSSAHAPVPPPPAVHTPAPEHTPTHGRAARPEEIPSKRPWEPDAPHAV